jgi:hypothetical protein
MCGTDRCLFHDPAPLICGWACCGSRKGLLFVACCLSPAWTLAWTLLAARQHACLLANSYGSERIAVVGLQPCLRVCCHVIPDTLLCSHATACHAHQTRLCRCTLVPQHVSCARLAGLRPQQTAPLIKRKSMETSRQADPHPVGGKENSNCACHAQNCAAMGGKMMCSSDLLPSQARNCPARI